MPRPRPPYLLRETNRHKKTVWYFRKGKGKRIRIYGEYGTPEFNAGYDAASAGEVLRPKKVSSQSLEWLISEYKKSGAWKGLSPATRDQRNNIFKGLLKSSGDAPFAAITKKKIIEGVDRRIDTPNQANNFIKTMRGLFKWAVALEHADEDPTAGVNLVKIKTDGFQTWTEAEMERFEAAFPRGTRERVWFDVLLYTGLRRGDAARLGPGHVQAGVFTIKTEKNGVEVSMPILRPLAETIAAGPVGTDTFICGARGEALTKESFGNYFRAACQKAGVPGSAHGLRKAGATRAVENGATHSQLRAMFGWTNDAMPSLYTRKADRARLASEAASGLTKVRGKREKP